MLPPAPCGSSESEANEAIPKPGGHLRQPAFSRHKRSVSARPLMFRLFPALEPPPNGHYLLRDRRA